VLGTLVTAGAATLGWLLLGQFVVGVGVAFSVASNISYLTEMVPPHKGGAMVALYELATTFGKQ
jgi:predicted MFS family arabinose efflux permease